MIYVTRLRIGLRGKGNSDENISLEVLAQLTRTMWLRIFWSRNRIYDVTEYSQTRFIRMTAGAMQSNDQYVALLWPSTTANNALVQRLHIIIWTYTEPVRSLRSVLPHSLVTPGRRTLIWPTSTETLLFPLTLSFQPTLILIARKPITIDLAQFQHG
jgi:hypothetical protein